MKSEMRILRFYLVGQIITPDDAYAQNRLLAVQVENIPSLLHSPHRCQLLLNAFFSTGIFKLRMLSKSEIQEMSKKICLPIIGLHCVLYIQSYKEQLRIMSDVYIDGKEEQLRIMSDVYIDGKDLRISGTCVGTRIP